MSTSNPRSHGATLSERCAHAFDDPIRQRGAAYFQQNRVRVMRTGDGEVWAATRGSGRRIYETGAYRAGGGIALTCGCPYAEQGEPCKHLWALLLTIDARRFPLVARGSQRLVVHSVARAAPTVHRPDGTSQPLAAGGANDRGAGVAGGGHAGHVGHAKLSAGRAGWAAGPAAWELALERIGAGATSAPMDGSSAARPFRVEFVVSRIHGGRPGDAREAAEVDDAVAIGFTRRMYRADGSLDERVRLWVNRHTIATVPDERDRRWLHILAGAALQERGPYYGAAPGSVHQVRVARPLAEMVLPEICEHGRLVYASAASANGAGAGVAGPDAGEPGQDELLAWDPGESWRFVLRLDSRPRGGLRVSGGLERGSERRALSGGVEVVCSGGLLLLDGTLARCEPGSAGWIAAFTPAASPPVASTPAASTPGSGGEASAQGPGHAGALDVPVGAEHRFMDLICRQPAFPAMDISPALDWKVVAGEPRPRLHLKAGRRDAWLEGQVSFSYGGPSGDPSGGQTVGVRDARSAVYDDETREITRRDRDAEDRLVADLAASGAPGLALSSVSEVRAPEVRLAAAQAPAAIRALLDRGWTVELSGKRVRLSRAFSLAVTTGIDWFDVAGTVDFDGAHAPFPRLLEAVTRSAFVTLDDGSVGLVTDDMLRSWGLLARLAQPAGDGGGVRLRRGQVGLLDALVEGAPAITVDAAFARLRRRLREVGRVRPAAAPRGFRGSLRDYQRDGLGWMQHLAALGFGGCLADDMGLGKTVQILALLQSRRARRRRGAPRKPSLVVAPRSVIDNWCREAARFAPRLRVCAYLGHRRHALRDGGGAGLAAYDLVITTYGIVRRDAAALRELDLAYAILDEAQAIKNPGSQAAKACRLLRADHRLALTGTPIENRLSDLGSIFEFLNPGILGRDGALAAIAPAGGGAARGGEDAGRAHDVALVARALRPFILRRTKEQVAPELPGKTEQVLRCRLRGRERRRYDELRAHFRAALMRRIHEGGGLARSKIHVLEALLRLRQAACHPGLLDPSKRSAGSAKLDLLIEQLQEVTEPGHKALVFSQFVRMLGIVKLRLDAAGIGYEYLDGRTRRRAPKIDRFQADPECRVFLISLKAGGQGLNLTAADYVYLLDPWWNPAVEAQAIDRAYRIGQTRPVFAYRLIAEDTVEDKVLELQARKRELADAIVTAGTGPLEGLSVDDLNLLLG